ncbi:MAG: hypothetical protein KF763_17610 [Cyclobacteriaceae bacterium]|nr:hypothetical protein [Cyclobacteriaceae bacterium]
MKYLIKISTLVLLMALVIPAYSKHPVNVIHTRNQYQFVFKVHKEMLGAHVQVISENGDQVDAQQLMKRKMVIDFTALPVGHYTIVVEKDGKTESFEFVRNWR